MAELQRRVTLKDVAKRAGVTPTAVSHVLNDRLDRGVRVSEKTKQRIKAVAAEMGYVPTLQARAMVDRKSYSVGVLCSLAGAPMAPATAIYYANALQGVEEVCKQVGYHCLYASCGLGSPEQFTMPRLMRDGSVDGIVIVGHASSEVVGRLKDMRLPCVQVGSNVDAKVGIDTVYPDLDSGLELAAARLVALGHRRVELVVPTGPGPKMHMRHFLSLTGKVDGLRPVSGMLPEEWGTTQAAVEHAGQWARRRADMPTAFICSPLHAEGLIRGFDTAGLELARDYSLIAFLPGESAELHLGKGAKRLTTLRFPIHEVARQAARKLFQLVGLRPDGAPLISRVPCQLHEGETCVPPPPARRMA